jgi:hypothetical protein
VTPAYHRSHDWPIYVIGALPLVGVLFLLAAELPARLGGGHWLPPSSSNWLERAMSALRDPLDPAGAWPAGSGGPGPAAYWSTLALLVALVLVPVLLIRSRRTDGGRGIRGRRRPGFATAREVRAALDGAEAGRIAAISVSLPVMRPRAARTDPPTSAARPGDQEGGRWPFPGPGSAGGGGEECPSSTATR